ncbi:MAG: hypothetical protein CMF62_01640 [Magnetococcales bacterium]|nr:hypothetical protein [Magnetococcales bacterium]
MIKYIEKDQVLDSLYTLKTRTPTKKDINKINKSDKNVVKFFKDRDYKDAIHKIKESISTIENKIPLYDVFQDNLFLINKENVYNRVVRQHYRFPDNILITKMQEKLNKMEKTVNKNLVYKTDVNNEKMKDILLARRYRKISLMIDFMSNFNIETLINTYVKVFYFYANEVGKNITLCIKPSFKRHFGHLDPYYSRSELINLALNMGLIKSDSTYYDNDAINNLCDKVKDNDISAKILEDHQNYIINNNAIGIVQYYSLQGSYFMNQYLRGVVDYESKNIFLEKLINSMWSLINKTPSFDKEYILYRFIQSDVHLSHLKIGDTYISPSFISTTRDPFYQSDNYKFGFILLKIKIPKNIEGVALCMETISLFPKEEEIILSPRSILKLEKKDSNVKYFHPDYDYVVKVTTKYEFSYIGKKPIIYPDRTIRDNISDSIDFLSIPKPSFISMEERARYFSIKYVNEQSQFKVNINSVPTTLMTEWYDSTNVYKKFYANTTENGFMIYTIDKDHITFTIELGEDENGSFMYVNYYLKYSVSLHDKTFTDLEFITFISKLGYYFEVKSVIIYADYYSCDLVSKKEYFGGNYCVDIEQYLRNKTKRFKDLDSTEIRAKFNYFLLDKLERSQPTLILNKDDTDEIFTIYKKVFLPTIDLEKENNLKKFYLWMIENYCYLVPNLVKKMERLYKQDNPFNSDYYVLDPNIFLYNRNLISTYDPIDNDGTPESSPVQKNTYRLDIQRKARIPKNRKI